jgi:hypothetical protein
MPLRPWFIVDDKICLAKVHSLYPGHQSMLNCIQTVYSVEALWLTAYCIVCHILDISLNLTTGKGAMATLETKCIIPTPQIMHRNCPLGGSTIRARWNHDSD